METNMMHIRYNPFFSDIEFDRVRSLVAKRFSDEIGECKTDFCVPPRFRNGMMYSKGIPHLDMLGKSLVTWASGEIGKPVKYINSGIFWFSDLSRVHLHLKRKQYQYVVEVMVTLNDIDSWPLLLSDPISDEQRVQYETDLQLWPDEENAQQIINNTVWHTVDLAVGEGVLYSGRNCWSRRPLLRDGSCQLLQFYYIDNDEFKT